MRTRRVLIIAAGLGLWFWTQSLIGHRPPPAHCVGDGLHELLSGANAWLRHNPRAANALLICSSACIDFLGLFILARAIFGPSLRPFMGLLALFALRQLSQALCALPAPEGMIWRYPGFPSLLVTYGTANDFFFSGHTGIAVYGAFELSRLKRPWLTVLGVAIALFEATTVLMLRSHYTMDVLAGILAAAIVAVTVSKS